MKSLFSPYQGGIKGEVPSKRPEYAGIEKFPSCHLGNASGKPPSMGSVAPVVGVAADAKKTTAWPT